MTKERYEEIVSYLREVIKGTSWEGKVYTVGGCLRDALMGRDIHDIDLAVAVPDGGVKFPVWLEKQGLTLNPPILYKRFSSSRLRLKSFPDEEIEVVQTRREQYTDANSRNPEVCFGSIQDDCERRDLTINSLYENVSTGEMLDLTGFGVADIKNKVIRTPMVPDETYKDDPIRILRTIRFAVRYGWDIPADVWNAMRDNGGRMKIVRRPRIRTEFEKIMLGNDPAKLLGMMKELGVIFRVMPELCHLYRLKDQSKREEFGPNSALPSLWDSTLEKLDEVVGTSQDSPESRYAALFTYFDKIKIPYAYGEKKSGEKSSRRGRGRNAVVTTALRRLLYDYDFIRKVKALLPPVKNEDETGETEKQKSIRSNKHRKRNRRRKRRNGAGRKTDRTA